tara:strand:- start:8024 stop:8269 length:246 start_codon:yes stop_codon:yes gene_type:complete
MKEIIDYKNQGFSDEETLKQLKVLERVMSTTKKQKVGRGKTATEIDVYVYDDASDKEVRERIKKSIKHYETKLENISTTNN